MGIFNLLTLKIMSTKLFLVVQIIFLMLSSCEKGAGESVNSGEVVWSVKNVNVLTVSTQPLIDQGRVFFEQDGYLKAYRLKEGTRLWQQQITTRKQLSYSRQFSHSKEAIYIYSGFEIRSYAKDSGSLLWTTFVTDDGSEVSGIGAPIMAQDELYLYASKRGELLQVQKSTGSIVQRITLDTLVNPGVVQGSTNPIAPANSTYLYVPTGYYDEQVNPPKLGGNVIAYDRTNWEIAWAKEARFTIPLDESQNNPDPDSASAVIPVQDISITSKYVIGLAGKVVFAYDRDTGEQIWYKQIRDEGWNFERFDGFDVGLATTEDAVYAVSLGGFAYRLDIESGEVLWSTPIGSSHTSIPTVENGMLYFSNFGNGDLWVLDTDTGNVIFNAYPPGYQADDFDVYISSLGVGEGYMVNVGARAVYCLKAF